MAQKIAILNRKGGVGKTTTAINLAAGLARQGKRVLLIDLDDQCNSTAALGYDFSQGSTIYEALIDRDLANASLQIYPYTDNFDFVAASQDLEGIETAMHDHFGADQKLKLLVMGVEFDYDAIIYDCPPNAGLMSRSSLIAADYVLIPHDCGQFSECGIPKAVSLCREAMMLNRDLKVLGFLRTKYKNTTLCHEAKDTLNESYPEYRVLNTTIKECAALGKTFKDHQTIFSYKGAGDPSQGRVDYTALAKEVIEICEF